MLSEAGRRAQRSFPRSRSIPTKPKFHWLDLACDCYRWMKETDADRDASTPSAPRVPLRSFLAQHGK